MLIAVRCVLKGLIAYILAWVICWILVFNFGLKSLKSLYDLIVLVAVFGGMYIIIGAIFLIPLLLLIKVVRAAVRLIHGRIVQPKRKLT